MRQSQIIQSVKDYLTDFPPQSWDFIIDEIQESYSVFTRFEAMGEKLTIAVLPASIEWERQRGDNPYVTHEIDVVLFGKNKEIECIIKFQDGLEEIAETFMNDGGPIDNVACIGARTLDAAKAGYDQASIHKTGEPFIAGIRLTFKI
jgi:hypothetical protein